LQALSREPKALRLRQNDLIGLLGIFDISDTIAVSVTYQLVLQDADYMEPIHFKEKKQGLTGIIIFVIAICSLIGLLLLILTTILVYKGLFRKKTLLINMDSDMSNKGRDFAHRVQPRVQTPHQEGMTDLGKSELK
jgi:hypothetical protein